MKNEKKFRPVSGRNIYTKTWRDRWTRLSLSLSLSVDCTRRRVSQVREIRANVTRRAVVADVSEIAVSQKTQPRETVVLVVDDFAEIKLVERAGRSAVAFPLTGGKRKVTSLHTRVSVQVLIRAYTYIRILNARKFRRNKWNKWDTKNTRHVR